MFSTSRPAGKGVSLLLAFVLAVFGLSIPSGLGVAVAEESGEQPRLVNPVEVTTEGAQFGHNIWVVEAQQMAATALFDVTLPGGERTHAYCINAVVASTDGPHNLSSFGGEGIAGGPMVRWVVENAYPEVSPAAMAANAGVPGDFTVKDAVTATQFAIWNFTNPDVERPQVVSDFPAIAARVNAVADYLIESATERTAPAANLSISSENATGNAGTDIGKFTVNIAADSAKLTLENAPEGVELVALDSNSAVGVSTDVTNSEQFAVRVPAGAGAGSATLVLEADVPLQAASVLVYEDGRKSQQLGLVSDTAPVRQQVRMTVDWDEAPAPAPSIGTRAWDKADSDKVIDATGGIVVDSVSFTGLKPGSQYTLSGTIMDADTGESTGVMAKKEFSPEASEGVVNLEFDVPADLAGSKLVVFERLYSGTDLTAEPVATHEDLSDEHQTVTVDKPVEVTTPVVVTTTEVTTPVVTTTEVTTPVVTTTEVTTPVVTTTEVTTPVVTTEATTVPGGDCSEGWASSGLSSSGSSYSDDDCSSALSSLGLIVPFIPVAVIAAAAGSASAAGISSGPGQSSTHAPLTTQPATPAITSVPAAPSESSIPATTDAAAPSAHQGVHNQDQEKPELLAKTGANTVMASLAGLMLLILGLGIVLVRRRS